jgi:hypothetical protein
VLGNGDGTLRPPVTYDSGIPLTAVAVGDFDRDGRLDVIVGGITNGPPPTPNFALLLGNGDGTFRPGPRTVVTYAGQAYNVYSMAVADFNRDGRLDIALETLTGNILIAMGNGDGTFQPMTAVTAPRTVTAILAADVDGDGAPDLVGASSFGDPQDWLFRGNGDGTFRGAVALALGARGTSALAVADFNGDGRPDLAVGTAVGVSVMAGLPGGGFAAGVNFGCTPDRLAVGDFNGDGRPDLMAVCKAGPTVLINDGT